MKTNEFWKLIELIDRDALNEGDEDGSLMQLQGKLSTLNDKEIFSFEDILSKLLFDLDTEKHAANSGESGESGDGFLYARCWVVAQGEKLYLNALGNPKAMPKSVDQWCEGMLYLAPNAWAKRSKSDSSGYPHVAEYSYETGSNEEKW